MAVEGASSGSPEHTDDEFGISTDAVADDFSARNVDGDYDARVDVRNTRPMSAKPNAQNLVPYVEITPLRPTRLQRDKDRSRQRRLRELHQRQAREREMYGGLIRHDAPCVFHVLDRADQVELDVELAFDVGSKSTRTFPVASTGWTGARVTHTAEERRPHGLEWYLDRGFTVQTNHRRYLRFLLHALSKC